MCGIFPSFQVKTLKIVVLPFFKYIKIEYTILGKEKQIFILTRDMS